MERYRLRFGDSGGTVYDIRTGQAVRFTTGDGAGMERQAAETLANVLNWRARQGDRKVFQ
jgi:hypothetical protein